MKIIAAKAYIKNLALKKPYLIATKHVTEVENVFVEVLLENGMTGMGACNPDKQIVNEDNAAALHTLREKILPFLIGKDIEGFARLIDEVVAIFKPKPGSLAAADIALHDAYALYKGITVADIFGRKISIMPTSVTIGIMPVKQAVEEAIAYTAQGFKAIKIKTGLRLHEDIETVMQIRAAVGNAIGLRVDANQGYSIVQLQQFIEGTVNAGIELLEQPLPPGKENDLRMLPPHIRKLLCADESLCNAKDAAQLAYLPLPYGVFNIKLMKCGGIREAMRIADVAKSAGIRLFWGCNDESIVSISAALHAAFACGHTSYIDLDGSFDLADDAAQGGFEMKDGEMALGANNGLGVRQTTLALQ